MIKKINSISVKSPSSCSWGLQDLSSEESGRTLDGIMHKDIIAQKEKLDSSWVGLTQTEAATLLQAVNASTFLNVTYDSPLTGLETTKVFYVGDRSAPVQMWTINKKIFQSVSFNFIEK